MREGDASSCSGSQWRARPWPYATSFFWNGQVALPTTSLGWTGFLGVAIAYTIGALTFFVAVPILGAVRAVMVSNIEPVLGVLFAVILIGESIWPAPGCRDLPGARIIRLYEAKLSLAGILRIRCGQQHSNLMVAVAVLLGTHLKCCATRPQLNWRLSRSS